MDLKQRKPVHLKCPNCGHDFAVNTNRIEEDYVLLKSKVTRLKAELELLNERNVSQKSPERKRLRALIADTNAQIVAIKKVRKALSEETEIQKYIIFYKKVKSIIGEEKTVKLMKEAEEELIFREYDLAIQKGNNFTGA